MTELTKRVKRRTLAPHRGRRIVVTLEPGDLIGFRLERTRRTWYTTLGACMDMAVRQTVVAERREKANARKARR